LEAPKKYIGDNMENKESFDELYNRLYSENFSELENVRQKNEKKMRMILIPMVIIFAVIFITQILAITGSFSFFNNADREMDFMIIFAISIPIIIAIVITILNYSLKIPDKDITVGEDKKVNYTELFKEKVVATIISNVFENSKYYYDIGLTENEYNEANWERYDIYDSEDKIVTEIVIDKNKDVKTNLVMSEIHTQDRRKDSDGDTHYVTMFHGLAGYADLPKDIGCYLRVIKNEFNLFGTPKDKLQMDMTEFEKIFDVKTDDRIKTMQILTADIMTELIQLVETTKVKFEFYINQNKMYIRFHTGEVFEPEVFGKAMQYKNLKKYFDIVSNVKNITEHICNVISNTEL